MSFCDPQTEGKPKSVIGIEIPLCCNFYLLNYKAQLFNLGLNQQGCKLTRLPHQKIGAFALGFIIVIVRTFRKIYQY